jgi:hypothetical protein
VTDWESISRSGSPTDVAGRLCRALAPADLEGKTLYVVLASEAGGPFTRLMSDCHGYTSQVLDLQLQPHLEARGLWRGRGPAMLLTDQPDTPLGRHSLFATVVHEFAHVLAVPHRGILRTLPPEDWPELARPFLDLPTDDAAPEDQFEVEPPGTNSVHHGAAWIRVCNHLAWRARSIGFAITSDDLSAGSAFYGLIGSTPYTLALGDEPRLWSERRLWDLLDTPLPPRFARLWEHDHARETAIAAAVRLAG